MTEQKSAEIPHSDDEMQGRAEIPHVEDTEVDDTTDASGVSNETPEPDDETQDDAETFPREYVQKLRDENAKYRTRAQQVDDYAHRLHTALVEATGRLQDASDLEFAQEHLDDPETLTAALTALLERKPHLASRKPTGDIGQGVSGVSDTFSLTGLLRGNAR